MYLTQFEINPARRGARLLLSSPHRMHGAVLAAFTPEERQPTETGRILWRVDRTEHRCLLYIVSPHRPDLAHLVEQAGWPSKVTWRTGDYRRLLDRLVAGQQWAFRLTANPVYNPRNGASRRRGPRYGHVTQTQQQEWLLKQAEKYGFEVSKADESPDLVVRDRQVRRFKRDDRQVVTISTATFDGRLTVTDPDALRFALTRGIGPAKGYGCGLLTLAR